MSYRLLTMAPAWAQRWYFRRKVAEHQRYHAEVRRQNDTRHVLRSEAASYGWAPEQVDAEFGPNHE